MLFPPALYSVASVYRAALGKMLLWLDLQQFRVSLPLMTQQGSFSSVCHRPFSIKGHKALEFHLHCLWPESRTSLAFGRIAGYLERGLFDLAGDSGWR